MQMQMRKIAHSMHLILYRRALVAASPSHAIDRSCRKEIKSVLHRPCSVC